MDSANSFSFDLHPRIRKNKAESEWMTGVFVGLLSRTTEYILMTKDGIYKTSNVKRASEGNQYDEKCLDWAAVDITELVNKGAVTRASGRPRPGREGHQEATPTEKGTCQGSCESRRSIWRSTDIQLIVLNIFGDKPALEAGRSTRTHVGNA